MCIFAVLLKGGGGFPALLVIIQFFCSRGCRGMRASARTRAFVLLGSFCWPEGTRDDRLVAVTEQGTGVPERWNAVGSESDMWMDPAQDPRFAAGAELEGERATLLDYLRACRLALELKCDGLDAEQLARRSVPPSTMSLLGLIRHMADVERNWFRRVMAQADAPRCTGPTTSRTLTGRARWQIRRWWPAPGAPGARRSPSRSSSSLAHPTSPSAALCKTARPSRCAR